jgi:phage terminase Nu1 subunit (DNA packaging protein)
MIYKKNNDIYPNCMKKVSEKKRGRPRTKGLWAKSLQELGALFGVSRQTIKLWIQKGAPPANASGFYDIEKWKDWVSKNDSQAPEQEHDGMDRATLNARQMHLKNQKLELELKRMRGEMMHVDDIRLKLYKSFEVCKRLQMRIGPSLAARLSGMTPAEIAKEITQAIKDTYGEIERWAVDMEKASTKPLSSVLADGDTDTLADKPDNSNEF